jgi:hypothetical protein
VRYSPTFAVRGIYKFPSSVLARFAPRSSSGGAWGRDGLLYVTGHDRPELYVLHVAPEGNVLQHIATVATPTGGQAIGWDASTPRLLWSIDRDKSDLVASQVPEISR